MHNKHCERGTLPLFICHGSREIKLTAPPEPSGPWFYSDSTGHLLDLEAKACGCGLHIFTCGNGAAVLGTSIRRLLVSNYAREDPISQWLGSRVLRASSMQELQRWIEYSVQRALEYTGYSRSRGSKPRLRLVV